LFEDRRCSLQRQGTLHLGVKTVIVVIRVPEIRSSDRALQFVANTGPAKIYFQWATHDMFISKYSAEEYYKAVDGRRSNTGTSPTTSSTMLNHVTTVVNGSRKNWGCTEGRRRYIQLRFVHVVVSIFPSAGGEVGDGLMALWSDGRQHRRSNSGRGFAVARLADDLNQRFPEDTSVQFNFLPTVRAASALQTGNGGKAQEALAAAQPYELGETTAEVTFYLYPVYLRAGAYLAEKQGTAAAAEFRKILDHPGLVQNEPIGALAHLGLGRAYALTADTGKAKAEYEEFLSQWKDADSDIPILKQAKAEYAKLH
jgi:hypothetical protein